MSGRFKTVTVGTDGLRDFVVMPDGLCLILGPVSVAKFVATCVPDRTKARKALDTFLDQGEAMVAIDLDKFENLVQPRRARWSFTDSLIHAGRQELLSTMEGTHMSTVKHASAQQVQAMAAQITRIEQQVTQISKLASDRMPTERAVQDLRALIGGLHFYDPGDQAKNDAWYTPGGKVDTAEDGKVNIPEAVANPKLASMGSVDTLNANADLADSILSQLDETNEKVDALVAAGKPFNASAAKADLHRIASSVQQILSDADLAMPYVEADLAKLAAEAGGIHRLFASAKV